MTKDEYKAWMAEIEVSNWDNLIRLSNIFAVAKRPFHKGKHHSKREDKRHKKLRNAIVARMAQIESSRRLKERQERMSLMWGNYNKGFISSRGLTSTAFFIDEALNVPGYIVGVDKGRDDQRGSGGLDRAHPPRRQRRARAPHRTKTVESGSGSEGS